MSLYPRQLPCLGNVIMGRLSCPPQGAMRVAWAMATQVCEFGESLYIRTTSKSYIIGQPHGYLLSRANMMTSIRHLGESVKILRIMSKTAPKLHKNYPVDLFLDKSRLATHITSSEFQTGAAIHCPQLKYRGFSWRAPYL